MGMMAYCVTVAPVNPLVRCRTFPASCEDSSAYAGGVEVVTLLRVRTWKRVSYSSLREAG